MSQETLLLLLLKIAILADIVSVAAFIAIYWVLAAWWRNPIGRTLVIKDMLLLLVLLPTVMSLFWKFNRLTSHIAAWIDVSVFALMAAVMAWRCAVWIRIHREKKTPAPEDRTGTLCCGA